MELIKITEQNGKQAVSARDLADFLEIKEGFNRWIARMFEYGFTESIDFQPINIFVQASNEVGGTNKKDYVLTIDCAKEISMIQRSEKGKIARQYFINCEKRLKNPLQNISRLDLARMLLSAEEENQRLQIEAKVNENKVLFTDAVIGSQSSCLIGELAKVISQNGYTIGQNRLFEWLRNNGYLGKKGERRNIPNQQFVEQGLFELKKGVRTGSSGELHTTITTKVTGKGQVYFVNKFLHNT